jgi:hypothetical protein
VEGCKPAAIVPSEALERAAGILLVQKMGGGKGRVETRRCSRALGEGRAQGVWGVGRVMSVGCSWLLPL